MKTHIDARAVALLVLVGAGAPGCLGTFEAPATSGDPGGVGSGGGASPDTTGGSGATGGTGGTGATGGTGGMGGAAPDLGSPATVDLGLAVADLAPSGDLAGACDKLQSTAALSSPSGRHNAGQECQGCHAPGGGAPTFYLGGTLYNAATGGAAVAGATIRVTDANGKQVNIVSATNGNFWTTTVLAYPVHVEASLCPSTLPMSASVSGNGACNNCHNSTFRVHVP
jgi:hypothetical protein